MSHDIRGQLRELGDAHRTSRRSIELAELEPPALSQRGPEAGRRLSGPVIALVVMAAVLLVAGGLALLLSTASDTPPADTVVPTTPVAPPTTQITPSTTGDESPQSGVRDLVWQRVDLSDVFGDLEPPSGSSVLDGGNKFVVFHGGSLPAEIRTSFDGVSWDARPMEMAVDGASVVAAWEGNVLLASGGGGWSSEENSTVFPIPSLVSAIQADGSVVQRIFDGDVESLAIGPEGIMVVITPHQSYGLIIDEILGPDFSASLYEASLREGVLYVETVPDGRTGEIALADHGLNEEDLNSSVVGWHSKSGTTWTPVPNISSSMKVVGTADGFIGIDGSTVWHSADGTAWTHLGDLPFAPLPDHFNQSATRWREGAVATDLTHFAYISPDGIVALPDSPMEISSVDQAPLPLWLSGGLGIFVVNPVEGELVFTRDGESWEVGQLPEDMTDSFGWYTSSGAVTDEALLLLLWEEDSSGGGQQPAWWVGTFPEITP